MIDFSTLTLQEAQAYRDAYVAAVPQRVAWLRQQVARSGVQAARLDGSPDSLVPLWEWFLGGLAAGAEAEGVEGRPPWYGRTGAVPTCPTTPCG